MLHFIVFLITIIQVSSASSGIHRTSKVRTEDEKKNYLDYIAKVERLWWAAHENDIPAAKAALDEGAPIDAFYVSNIDSFVAFPNI